MTGPLNEPWEEVWQGTRYRQAPEPSQGGGNLWSWYRLPWRSSLYWFPRVTIAQCHSLGGLNNGNVVSHSSRARSSRPSCWQSWFLLKALREDLLRAPLLALVVCWQSLAFLGLWSHHPVLCLHVCLALSLCVFLHVQITSFYVNTSHTDLGPTLLQNDLISTKSICNDPICS